jgi:hypothetical protein
VSSAIDEERYAVDVIRVIAGQPSSSSRNFLEPYRLAYTESTAEPKAIDIQIYQLLGSHASTVQQPKQCVVAPIQQRLTIDFNKKALHGDKCRSCANSSTVMRLGRCVRVYSLSRLSCRWVIRPLA